ncbi:MAG: aldehyde dehydrogenase family protein, partial [Ignavibacteriales bacterium]|nr:aldehyde dehydrogenase family protein [Ignavibacteriales bacterium]
MSADAQPYILGGERRFLSPASPHVQLVHNPWDDSVVGAVVTAESDAADEAIESARRGFERSRALSSYQRSESLAFITARLRETKEDFARLITAEVGKPIAWSRVEVERAIITFGLASEEAKRMGGDLMPLDLQSGHEDRFGIVRRFPRGIVLCITPFNFPLNLVAHKVAPAIASGNAFILKPAPQAPLTALKLGEIIADSGYPKEAFSILPCANEVAEKMVADLRIHMLSFTGSHSIGWMLKEKAGKKKVVLELGGNAGVIVDGSANVIPAVKKNVVGAFVYAGQVCIKVQRIFVHEDIFDEYRRQFAAEAASAATGDPLNPETLCGPLIDDKAVVRVRIWLEEAKRSGARVLTGGTFNNRLL